MKVITYLYNNWKEVLHLDEGSKQALTNLWHQDHSLARYTKDYGIDVIQSINTKGIALYDSNGNRVKLVRWKNINLIGKTARQKAKERQKKSPNTP